MSRNLPCRPAPDTVLPCSSVHGGLTVLSTDRDATSTRATVRPTPCSRMCWASASTSGSSGTSPSLARFPPLRHGLERSLDAGARLVPDVPRDPVELLTHREDAADLARPSLGGLPIPVVAGRRLHRPRPA